MARKLRTIGRLIAQLLALALIGMAFFVRTPQVSGPSMEPRIQSGEFVLINTLAYRLEPVRRGDIVAFHHDSPTEPYLIKRVVGLPGDRLSIDRGVVAIGGVPLAEPYVRFKDQKSAPAVTIPAETYYVLGDNRANSDDSRDWGVLAKPDIIGKAAIVIWPPHLLGAR